jgi:hypothetical protein
MLGLIRMPASGASLLLNAESVFSALLAWFVFKENVDRRIALGLGAILAVLLILSCPGEAKFGGVVPALCVLGAFSAGFRISDSKYYATDLLCCAKTHQNPPRKKSASATPHKPQHNIRNQIGWVQARSYPQWCRDDTLFAEPKYP